MTLDGLRVLVTRPEQQATGLLETLRQHGAEPVAIPALNIVAIVPDTQLLTRLSQLDQYQLAIFISTNAVEYGLSLLDINQWPCGLAIAAIGSATAKSLAQYGLKVSLTPDTFDSESLLAMPEMQEKVIKHQKILIFRGGEGREHLRDVLESRNAMVEYADVYQRQLPEENAGRFRELIEQHGLDVMVVTSNNSLDNIIRMLNVDQLNALQQIPLIVPSQRSVSYAQERGFKRVLRSDNASDTAILNCLYNGLKTIRSAGT